MSKLTAVLAVFNRPRKTPPLLMSSLPNRTGDEACDGCDRKRHHWLVLLVASLRRLSGLLSHAIGHVFCLLSNYLHLIPGGIAKAFRAASVT